MKSIPEVASELGVSDHTIRRWIKNRKLGCIRLGPKSIRIKPSEVERYVREKECKAIL